MRTSLLSPLMCKDASPRSAAASRPMMSPLYSATLLVCRCKYFPPDQIHSSEAPTFLQSAAPHPAIPGFPREPPSKYNTYAGSLFSGCCNFGSFDKCNRKCQIAKEVQNQDRCNINTPGRNFGDFFGGAEALVEASMFSPSSHRTASSRKGNPRNFAPG